MVKCIRSPRTTSTSANFETRQASPVAPKYSSRGGSTSAVPSLGRRMQNAAKLAAGAARTVLTLIRHGVASGSLACLVSYTFTLGNVLSGQPAAYQSDVAFQTATGTMIANCYCTALFVTSALSLGVMHRVNQPELRWGFSKMAVRLLKHMLGYYLLTHALVIWITYTVLAAPDNTAASSKVHLYANGLVITVYHAGVDEACRTIYRRETIEGRRSGVAHDAPYWTRYLRALARTRSFAVVSFVAAGFLHACTALTLDSELDLAAFSLASLALKSLVLWFTRHVVLQKKNMKLRTIYVMTAVPTVVINTQVRLFILRSDLTSSIRSFLVLAVLEPTMRVAKTWSVQRMIAQHETSRRSSRSRIGSFPPLGTATTAPITSARAVFPTGTTTNGVARKMNAITRMPSALLNAPLAWRNSLLTFHAAEIHADMCSEYIAIACSMSIYHFFRSHPKFGWYESKVSDVSSFSSENRLNEDADGLQRLLIVTGYQVTIELVVDFMCCMWELSHGIPLRSSDRLGSFLTAVFTSCAFIAISITASLYVHQSE